MKNIPSSVYRLQLNENFKIKDAIKLLPYLKKMGVEGVYCSPYFAAYSPHGYDVVDPNRINPQIGTQKEFDRFCTHLKKYGLAHIADIVPNHMGILGENKWWQDVLKQGKGSKYADFFDIDWTDEQILVPILGESFDEELKNKKLTKRGEWLRYHDQKFPLSGIKNYRLVHWLMSAQETSYRRFFNINELIGLRMEEEAVFDAHHKMIFQLLKEGKVDGLRVDHPDGLYDPKTYFERLRKKHKGLIVVEKILGWKEDLPRNWEVDGTVGYEFLNHLTGIYAKKSPRLDQVYASFIGKELNFDEMLYEKKLFFMATEMAGDIRKLAQRLFEFSSKMRQTIDLPAGDIIKALYELLASFPVYRSYIGLSGDLSTEDKEHYREAFLKAREKNRELGHQVFDFLEDLFFLRLDTPYVRDFILRFQQLSAPIMAKGFEDIALYNYNRLLALNEVGSDPKRGGVTEGEFHTFCKRKQEKWPLGFLPSSTHDTKRSLDTRMQIAVLSEIPLEWEKAIFSWSKMNLKHKTMIGGKLFPEPNMEYLLYQTMLGAWPGKPTFTRLWTCFEKSIREARVNTSWRHPDIKYEKACKGFLRATLKKGTPFQKSFQSFHQKIKKWGESSSLSATAIKLGSPGIVDIYEGCENFRYLLVDPDNRRAADFPKNLSTKGRLHKIALNFRKEHKDLFLDGKYVPVEVEGPFKEHIIAYLRVHKGEACLVAGLRYFASLKSLKETHLLLPKDFGRGREIFSQEPVEGRSISAQKLLSQTPYAWVYWERQKHSKK